MGAAIGILTRAIAQAVRPNMGRLSRKDRPRDTAHRGRQGYPISMYRSQRCAQRL